MTIKRISKLFSRYSVAVFGAKGCGKDLLMGNVILRRKLPYVSNTDYGGKFIPLDLSKLDCGGNSYKNFISGNVLPYRFPYEDKTDIYIADVGVYFPSQYCNELNKAYPYISVFDCLSRHLGDSRLHWNVQQISRCYDKLREHQEKYIMCLGAKVIFGFVFQKIRIYEKYQSACDKVLPWRIKLPLVCTKATKMNYELSKQQYENSYGKIRDHILVYRNKSTYDTRIFKKMLGGDLLEEKK